MIITEHRVIVFPGGEEGKSFALKTQDGFSRSKDVNWATHLDLWPEQCILTLTASLILEDDKPDEETEEE